MGDVEKGRPGTRKELHEVRVGEAQAAGTAGTYAAGGGTATDGAGGIGCAYYQPRVVGDDEAVGGWGPFHKVRMGISPTKGGCGNNREDFLERLVLPVRNPREDPVGSGKTVHRSAADKSL